MSYYITQKRCIYNGIGLLMALTASLRSAAADEFPRPQNTENSAQQPMSPAEVCKTARLPPGFHLKVFAAEPDVQNPIAMTTDSRGRLWVAENYTWAGADADNFDTSLRDRVVILEDTNGDGEHDKRTVFYDQAMRLTSVEVGLGGVWLLCSPHLLFIPDRNRDDVPDGPAEIVLDGFDIASVSHTVANGLKWGPDGWLYGRQGILGTSKIGPAGADDADPVTINTGIWRVHPTRRVCEAVMHGMTNPWGFDYDAFGEMFVINTVIGHLWHVLPGARTERMFGTDFNPHAYQLILQVADHVHWHTGEAWSDVDKGVSDRTSAAGGGHAHTGLMIYQGGHWPKEYRGRILTLNLHGRRLNVDKLVEKPVGYSAVHSNDMCFIADPFFRGMDVIAAADGGAYVADWSDTGECHEIGGVHRLSGRIYKLAFGESKTFKPVNLAKLSNIELAKLQLHANDWNARQARRVLQERASAGSLKDESARNALLSVFNNDPDPVHRCRAMWAMEAMQCVNDAWLLERLNDSNVHVRVWAIRLILDHATLGNTSVSPDFVKKLGDVASRDPSGLVLLYVASALQKLPMDVRMEVAEELAARSEPEFNENRTLSIMLWLGIEPLVAADPTRSIALLDHAAFPLVRENIARRITFEIDHNMPAVERLFALARERADIAPSILRGVAAALNGRKVIPVPANWSNVSAELSAEQGGELGELVRTVGVMFRDPATLDELRRVISDATARPEARRQALELLIGAKPKDLSATLRDFLTDRDLSTVAIGGLAHVEDVVAADSIVTTFQSLSPEARLAAIETLVSRPSYARRLMKALELKQIAAVELSAFHARQIRSFNDAKLSARLREVWGDVRDTPAERRNQIDSLKHTFNGSVTGSADPENGKKIFERTCASCHVLFGEGKQLGPDLTGSNRKNLDYLLENIIDPSAVVGADFRSNVYFLQDGRVVTGVVREKNDRTLTLATPEGLQTIDRKEIDEVQESQLSIMPDGLLQSLTESEIRDLLGYLMSN